MDGGLEIISHTRHNSNPCRNSLKPTLSREKRLKPLYCIGVNLLVLCMTNELHSISNKLSHSFAFTKR